MIQQINLYQPIFRVSKQVFSAMTMLQAGVFFIIVFADIYIYGLYQSRTIERHIEHIDRDINILAQKITQFGKKDTDNGKGKLLDAEIARITETIAQRERIYHTLSKPVDGNAEGFSPYMAAFARGHLDGTWLTKINVANGGSKLVLEGKTLTPDMLPNYMQRLGKEEALAGVNFDYMGLIRSDLEPDRLNFKISTD